MDLCEWGHWDWERLELSETHSQGWSLSELQQVSFFFKFAKSKVAIFFFLKEGNGGAKAQSQNNENQKANDTG